MTTSNAFGLGVIGYDAAMLTIESIAQKDHIWDGFREASLALEKRQRTATLQDEALRVGSDFVAAA